MTARIAVVSHDASSNALGRALVLAELLDAAGATRVIGFGSEIWRPAQTSRDVTILPMPRTTFGVRTAGRELRRSLAGATLIVACKTRLLSYGLSAVVRDGRPLILDIDDLEHAFVRRRFGWIRQVIEPDREPVTRLLERLRQPASAVTVASRALQRRFGGTWLPHIRDRKDYASRAIDEGPGLRRQIGIEDRLVIGFVGTPRPHKGLSAVARAVAAMQQDAILLVVGSSPADPEIRRLRQISEGRLVSLDAVPIAEVPAVLGACDMVVVPQALSIESTYQSPAKLFDAMAAGCAVVATDVGDAREVLGGAGLIVPASDPMALKGALNSLEEPARRARLGRAALARYRSAFALGAWQEVIGRVVAEASASKGVD